MVSKILTPNFLNWPHLGASVHASDWRILPRNASPRTRRDTGCCWKGGFMFRVLIAIGAAYGLGHPALDGYRPSALDKPLHGFYFDVNTAVIQCEHVVKSISGTRVMFYLGKAYGRMASQLHS
jgi:hypothetical protein